jgi:DNA (cytosine-5)-methyltransferase 1
VLTILDLFSGIGGFSYAAEVLVGGYKTIGFCEYDKKCQEVLKLRFPGVPIYPDIRELNEETLADSNINGRDTQKRGSILEDTGQTKAREDVVKTSGYRPGKSGRITPIHADIITGGYPCQPFSQAGKRGGEDDDRHLWPEMFRVIQLVKPKYVICENVAGHISMGLDSVLSDLGEGEGYTTEVFVLPACAVDAKHRRDRVWIMAYSEGVRSGRRGGGERADGREALVSGKQARREMGRKTEGCSSESREDVAYTNGTGLERQHKSDGQGGSGRWENGDTSQEGGGSKRRNGEWLTEPSVGRVAHGIPNRIHRLKQLGNSIVPQIAEVLFRAIIEAERRK